jgi:hypothetical protein
LSDPSPGRLSSGPLETGPSSDPLPQAVEAAPSSEGLSSGPSSDRQRVPCSDAGEASLSRAGSTATFGPREEAHLRGRRESRLGDARSSKGERQKLALFQTATRSGREAAEISGRYLTRGRLRPARGQSKGPSSDNQRVCRRLVEVCQSRPPRGPSKEPVEGPYSNGVSRAHSRDRRDPTAAVAFSRDQVPPRRRVPEDGSEKGRTRTRGPLRRLPQRTAKGPRRQGRKRVRESGSRTKRDPRPGPAQPGPDPRPGP